MFIVSHSSRLVFLGFGSVGRSVLPLILRHIAIHPTRITVITSSESDSGVASQWGVNVIVALVTKANYRNLLLPLLRPGDLLLNLAIHVATAALVTLCGELNALYLDTAIEPWPDVYRNHQLPPAARTSYALRKSLRNVAPAKPSPTALVAHGANPGLVSHFVKDALLKFSRRVLNCRVRPHNQAEWAALASMLRVKAIHITECDTQAAIAKRTVGEFVNTWSPEGLIDEACQPAEFAWGTLDHWLPRAARRLGEFGDAVFLARPGGTTMMQTWTPAAGHYRGFLLSHVETLSIADLCTAREAGTVLHRPTVQFIYRPCDDAVASIIDLARSNWAPPRHMRVLLDEVVSGADELGVLLMGMPQSMVWFGSRLSATAARSLVESSNATTLQVAAGVLGGLVWVLENPSVGLCEPEDIDHERVLTVARPYLGELEEVYTDWTFLDETASRLSMTFTEIDPTI